MTEPLGKPTHFTLHWTAGTHDMTFPEYHWCVKGSGVVVQTLSMLTKGAHCWGRNTGNIGVSMCAMAAGHPVTAIQVEHTANLVAELCRHYGIDPRGTLMLPKMRIEGERLVSASGELVAPVIADHAWYAHRDGYFPERWDVGEYFTTLVNKAHWYFDTLKAGHVLSEFTTKIH